MWSDLVMCTLAASRMIYNGSCSQRVRLQRVDLYVPNSVTVILKSLSTTSTHLQRVVSFCVFLLVLKTFDTFVYS